MDRIVWQTIVHGDRKESDTAEQLTHRHIHTHIFICIFNIIQDTIETIIIHYKILIIVSCAIVGPCCLSILCTVVSANPEFLIYPFLHTLVPFGNNVFFSMSENVFLFRK